MMRKQYPILIEHGDKDTAWGIIVPDLPGCFSAADNEEDIFQNAKEAILLHLEDAKEIPKASSMSDFQGNKEYKNFFVSAVEVDLSSLDGPSKRINVSLPENLIESIDAVASNRSKFLADAAREKLGKETECINTRYRKYKDIFEFYNSDNPSQGSHLDVWKHFLKSGNNIDTFDKISTKSSEGVNLVYLIHVLQNAGVKISTNPSNFTESYISEQEHKLLK